MDSGRGMVRVGRWVCVSLRSNVERPRLIGPKTLCCARNISAARRGQRLQKGQTRFQKPSGSLAGVRYERGGLCGAIFGSTLGKGYRRVDRKLRSFPCRMSAGIAVLRRGFFHSASLRLRPRVVAQPESVTGFGLPGWSLKTSLITCIMLLRPSFSKLISSFA